MAVRILYWNIEKFALNKIGNPRTNKRQKGASVAQAQAAADRLEYITDQITAANPEIIVVVEVATGYDAPGRLVRGAGLNGSLELLEEIRNATGDDDWMLVPPLQTGPNEAVAVYYLSTNLYFSGPNRWPGGGGATSQGAGGYADYPNDFDGTLPNRDVPDDAIYNDGQQEDQCAACVTFSYNANNALLQGQVVGFVGRAPYMVSFAEVDGNDDVISNITLFVVHAPANNFGATAFLNLLADLDEITTAPANDEIMVVLGDFNVNVMSAPPAYTERAAYQALQNAGYTLAWQPLGVPPAPVAGYEGYYATHIRRPNNAIYWSTQTLTTYYPGYGYIGADLVQNLYAIDNLFVQYGAGLAPPGNNHATIQNGIVGSPYTANAAPGPGVPVGSVVSNIRMAGGWGGGPFQNPPAQGPPFSVGRWSSFKGWANYGFIRSTSDHLALIFDI
ncbi:MAG: hypothetical protein JST22_10105 [Bacteroidetes bacterium]|nr:hypothetical protein [Bacteroidota bacterium]